MFKYVSLALWSALYFKCLKEWPAQKPEWASRLVTFLHGSVATIISLWLCGQPSFERCTEQIGPFHNMLMIWSWGYFAFDFLWCIYYWPTNWLMLVHHASALAGITMYMGKPYSGCIFPCTLAFMEVTNPLLQTRWFLREYGYDKTKVYFLIEVIYLLLFIVLRAVVGTYIIFKILYADEFKSEDKMISLVFYCVSIAFVYEIVGYVLYKYNTKFDEFQGFYRETEIILNYHF